MRNCFKKFHINKSAVSEKSITSNLSEISQNHSSDEESSSNSQYNTEIIKNVGLLIALILLILALFLSWNSARRLILYLIHILTYCEILSIGTLQAKKIGNLLKNFEIFSSFFSQMSQPLQHIQCNEYDITNLIKFSQTVNKFSLFPISVFHLTYPNFTSCRIEINRQNTSNFNLIYFSDYNDSYLQSYRFNENTDYDNWDPMNKNAFFNYFNKDIFTFWDNANSYQFWENEVDFNGNSEWNELLAIYTLNQQNDSVSTLCSACLNVRYLLDSLLETNNIVSSHFALIRAQKSDVILTSDLGIIKTLGFENKTLAPIFPLLSQLNSTFWKLVSVALSGKNYNELVIINTTDEKWKDIIENGDDWKDDLDGSSYAALKSQVISMTSPLYDIITVIKLDETISEYYYNPTIVFIILWVFLAIVYIFSRIVLKYAIIKNPSKSIEIINNSSSTLNESIIMKNNIISPFFDTNTSTIWKSINQIRNFQIAYPDDIDLNKYYDEIVSELAQPKERLFSVSVNKDCKFCSSLVDHQITHSAKNASSNHFFDSLSFSSSSSIHKTVKNKKNDKSNEEQMYEIWKTLSKQYLFNIDQIPDWKIIKNNPIKSLIFAYLDLIQQFNLAIPEFDPDIMIQFMIEFSSKCITHHFYTIFVFHHLVSLLSGPFNNWLLQKIDIFILFFVAFTKDANLDEFHESFPNINDTLDEDSLIQEKYMIFNDKYSQTERRLEFLFSIFYKYFPPRLQTQYFEENVRDIFFDIQNFNRNELFSTFNYRVQSPDFNVHSDILDKRLFIKAILCLCSQWPYFSTEDLMLKSLKNINSVIFHNFNNSDEPDFIPSYHYYYAELFVKPWVDLFNQFSPLPDLVKNLNDTILYWKQIEENMHKLEVK